MMKVDEIAAWEAFLGVATCGSFSGAARQMDIPLSQISKRISRLESRMGVRLFQRSTRSVTLTDEGNALRPRIRSILEDLQEVEGLFEGEKSLSGKIKVTTVPFIAHNLLIPILVEFGERHPRIRFELELSEQFVNLIDGGYDMAIRIETPRDSSLVYRRLVPNELILCASPKYLKRNKARLSTPEDLRNHDLLTLGIHRRCQFRNRSLALGELASSRKLTCENGAFLTTFALEGGGVLVRSIWDVRRHLKSGALVQVLGKYPIETFGYLHAVVPSKRYLAPRVRAFLDFVVEKSRTWETG